LREFVDGDLESGSLARNEAGFFCEGEGDCTSERRAGQFSIFGAVEEKNTTDSAGSAPRWKLQCEEWLRLWIVVDFAAVQGWRKNLVEWAAGLSTELAQEMQKSVVG
jgi:hypothetical protein